MQINFKLLSTFLLVSEHASFRKAADAAHRSLPAISMQISQLEEQLGVALFQRTTRRVELTREGESLLITARKAMAELESGLLDLQQAVDIQQGRLSFACVPTVASSRLPRILTTFASKYPKISVHVRELANQDLLEAVRRREVDFGIGLLPDKTSKGDLGFSPIFVDDYCALLPSSYRDEGRASISLKELAKMPLLKMSSSTAFRDHIDITLKANGLVSESNYEFSYVNTLVAMAEAGLGIALLPRVALPPRTKLKAVKIIGPALSRTIAIITIRGNSHSPAAARFVELCNSLMDPRK